MMRYHLKTNDFLVQWERWERVVDSAHCNIQSLKNIFLDKNTFYKETRSFGSFWGPPSVYQTCNADCRSIHIYDKRDGDGKKVEFQD